MGKSAVERWRPFRRSGFSGLIALAAVCPDNTPGGADLKWPAFFGQSESPPKPLSLDQARVLSSHRMPLISDTRNRTEGKERS